MKQEDKELLLKDLSARLSYGVICNTPKGDGHLNSINQTIFDVELGINVDAIHRDTFKLENCKPYLRPMSSMTKEEFVYFMDIRGMNLRSYEIQEMMSEYFSHPNKIAIVNTLGKYSHKIDWLNKKMFDYRELIEKGLALEAPEGMYDN